MTHLWLRAEQRAHEERVGLTPEGAAALIKAGIRLTVEESSVRAIPLQGYIDAGAEIAPENSWPDAPRDASGAVTATVVPGSTLWAIASETYGDGVLYVRVFEANRDKIRNPDLIYPGQIFDLPRD